MYISRAAAHAPLAHPEPGNAVGVVEEVGSGGAEPDPGTRVVVGSTLSCGYCSYCRSGTYSRGGVPPGSVRATGR
jgi:threonine dehydrogenase-like Zn-dependent dehydrogenase